MVDLNMCDWISCSSPAVLHVPSQFVLCALARKGVRGALPPGLGVLGAIYDNFGVSKTDMFETNY